MSPGEYRIVKDGKDTYILTLRRIVQPDAFDRKSHRSKLSENLESMIQNDFIEAFLQCLRARYPVKIHPEAFAEAVKGLESAFSPSP